MHWFLVMSVNITTNHKLQKKLDSLNYIFVPDSMNLISMSFTRLAPKLCEFSEMMQYNAHCAVQSQLKAYMQLPVSELTLTYTYLAPFPFYYRLLVKLSP